MAAVSRNELIFFLLGILLSLVFGILANFFVEFWVAWQYPQGVPQDQGQMIALLSLFTMILDGIALVIAISLMIRKPQKSQ